MKGDTMKSRFQIEATNRAYETEVIEADYFVLQSGHLIFRNERSGTYPETVRVLAPGSWAQLKNLGFTEPTCAMCGGTKAHWDKAQAEYG
jgi:hypothetical protein